MFLFLGHLLVAAACCLCVLSTYMLCFFVCYIMFILVANKFDWFDLRCWLLWAKGTMHGLHLTNYRSRYPQWIRQQQYDCGSCTRLQWMLCTMHMNLITTAKSFFSNQPLSPSWFDRSRWNLASWEVLGGSIPSNFLVNFGPLFSGSTNFRSQISLAFFNRSPQNFAWLGVLWSSIP